MTTLCLVGGYAEDRGDDIPAQVHLLRRVEQVGFQAVQIEPQVAEHNERGPDIERVGGAHRVIARGVDHRANGPDILCAAAGPSRMGCPALSTWFAAILSRALSTTAGSGTGSVPGRGTESTSAPTPALSGADGAPPGPAQTCRRPDLRAWLAPDVTKTRLAALPD